MSKSKKYNVQFELYGKKMQTTIEGENVNEIISIIKNKIIFHNITEIKHPLSMDERLKCVTDDIFNASDDVFDSFSKIFGGGGVNFKKNEEK